MKSTSISDEVLVIKGLSLSFNLSLFQSKSIRDFFVEFMRSPMRFFFNRSSKLEVVKDLNLVIKRGERVGLVGKNGAGKTSLCRSITGMYGVKKEIQVNGQLRAIFDTASVVHPELSGRENAWIITDIIYSHLSKKERADIVKDSLEFSELKEFIDQPFKHYSKGMKVRMFLSIVSAAPCDLLILDEVFNGADQFFNEKISERIKNVIKQSGAVIFISHSEEIIKEVCNRVIVLGNRNVMFDGGVEEGMEFYKQRYGASGLNEVQFG